jgi:hypothetical protein
MREMMCYKEETVEQNRVLLLIMTLSGVAWMRDKK